MTMPGRPSPPRRRLQPAEVLQVERWSRALANTTVQALDAVESTTSPTQVRALLAVEATGGCSNVELAQLLAIFPSSASRLTDRLTAAGLITRQAGQEDRREICLVLTPAGRRSVEKFVEARVSLIGGVMSLMSQPDRSALLRGLTAFSEAAHRLGDGPVE